MPRPRPTTSITSRRYLQAGNSDHALPTDLAELVGQGHPAIEQVTIAVGLATLAGEDTSDPQVISRCIREGKAAHAASALAATA